MKVGDLIGEGGVCVDVWWFVVEEEEIYIES